MRTLAIAMLTISASLVGRVTEGAITYSYAFDQSEYVGGPGGIVPVEVYVVETRDGVDLLDPFLFDDLGLSGAGVRLSYTGLTPPSPASVVNYSDITINDGPAGFDDLFNSPLLSADIQSSDPPSINAIAGLLATRDISHLFDPTGVTSTDGDASSRRILLGTFNFTLGSTLFETTYITATELYSFLDETSIWNEFTFLDSSIVPAQASLTVVPEPSTALLWSGGLAIVFVSRWRSRRKHNAKNTAGN